MSKEFVDTYFLDSKTALKAASNQNRVNCTRAVDGLQICYYTGKKLKNAPKNCINVPLEKVYSYFKTTKNRHPSLVCFENTGYAPEDQKAFIEELTQVLSISIADNTKLVKEYENKIKKNRPDFNEKTWRVFIPACRETTVMQYVSKNIAKEFKKRGFDVKYFIQKNDMQSCCALESMKAIYKFNPHITVHINHPGNDYLHKDVFNFVWFQDAMPVLLTNERILIREKDTFFIYLNEWKNTLISKGISPKKIYPQYSCINKEDFFIDKGISKENKIVFAGTYYSKSYIKNFIPFMTEPLSKTIYSLIEDGVDLSVQNISRILTSFQLQFNDNDILHIQQVFIRNKGIQWLAEVCDKLQYNLELYGWAWEKNENKTIKKYYKGSLPHDKIKDLYNSSKYTYLSSGRTINTQRLAESSACGSIPVIFDSRNITLEEETWDKEVLYFKSKRELENIIKLQLEPEKDFKKIAKTLSYKNLVKKMAKIIKEGTKKEPKLKVK